MKLVFNGKEFQPKPRTLRQKGIICIEAPKYSLKIPHREPFQLIIATG